jgi:tRNA(Ile)-lysidine synthase
MGVVYVDHGQHEKSQLADQWVKKRTRRWKLPYYSVILKPIHPASSETLLRERRYEILESIAKKNDYTRIATGHIFSDQVETLLMRIIRGTGTLGLSGIPKARDVFIRPFLETSRSEIYSYLRSRRLRWVEDPTNKDKSILRNWIRLELLPKIRNHANPNISQALHRLSVSAQRDNTALEEWAGNFPIQQVACHQVMVNQKLLKTLPPAIQSRLVLRMMQQISDPVTRIQQVHLERLLKHLNLGRSNNWIIDLGSNIQARAESDRFFITKNNSKKDDAFFLSMEAPGRYKLPGIGQFLWVRFEKGFCPDPRNANKVSFDSRKIAFPLFVRSLVAGDKMQLWGGVGSKKVSRLLIDAKVPKTLRKQMVVVVQEEKILWAPGLRRSLWYPVDDLSKVLTLELVKDKSRA